MLRPLGRLVEVEKVFKAITGAGVGALLAFALIVAVIPDLTDVRTVLGLYPILMGTLGFLFSRRGMRFRTSSLSYLMGITTVVTVMALSSIHSVGRGVLFLILTISLLVVLYPNPTGILDVLLSGPLYFAGATTVIVIVGALNLPGNGIGIFMVAVFLGFLGMIGVIAGSAARLLFTKPKP